MRHLNCCQLLEELAGFVCQALKDAGVTVTLSGGSCVAIWSQGKCVSNDFDFIEDGPASPMKCGKCSLASMGILRLLAPTDCMKDRLAAFYHWKDAHAIEQALLVARVQPVDLNDVARWSKAEGQEANFKIFKQRI